MDNLKKIQNIQYILLKDIVDVFEKNGIKYSLAYGSFLGAIRHHGPIPWDDDVDIYIFDQEFNKKLKTIKNCINKDYFIQHPDTEIITPWIYYKVRKNSTYMHESEISEIYKDLHQGIWIDLFPLVKASKYKFLLKKQLYLIRKEQILRFYFSKGSTRKNKIWNYTLKVLYKLINSLVNFLGSNDSKYYIIKANDFYNDDYKTKLNKILLPKKYIDNKRKYRFKNSFFWGPKNYDDYLRFFYGENYMIPIKYAHNVDYSEVKF